MPRFYLDLRAHRERDADGQTPFTPAIAVVYQVDEGIRLMSAEGAERDLRPPRGVRRRAAGRARGARVRAVRRPALRVADGHRGAASPTTSTGRRSTASSRRRGVVLAGGQGKLTGKIFRLGHLGSVTRRGDPRRDEHARDRVDREPGRPVRPGVAVARRRRSRAARVVRRRRAGRRRGRRVRVLVAEPVAAEGVELLRARSRGRRAAPGCRRDELCAILPDYDALDRPQPGPGRRRARSPPARGSWSSAGPGSASTTSTSTRRRGPGSRSSTPRPATRSRPPSTPSRCSTASPARSAAADASVRRGEWKRAQFTGPRAARPDARHRRARQDRAGHRGPGAGDGDDRPRRRPVRDRRAGRQPRRRAGRRSTTLLARADVVTVHVPLTRATRGLIGRDRDRPAQAGLDRPQRRPRRRRRRGGRRRGAPVAATSAAPASTSSSTSRRPSSPLLDAPEHAR